MRPGKRQLRTCRHAQIRASCDADSGMKEPLKVLSEGRTGSAAFILVALLGQALSLGLAAISTRDAFVALRGDGADLLVPVTLLGLAGVGASTLQYIARIEAERLGYDFARTLRSALYLQYARMPASEITRRRLGSLSLRFVGDLTAARGWAGAGMNRAAAAVIVLPAAAARGLDKPCRLHHH